MFGVGLGGSRRIKAAQVGRAVGPDGSEGCRPIVWMIKWMIKAHPTEIGWRAVDAPGSRQGIGRQCAYGFRSSS
jgi:hypothetical protein